MFSPAQVEQLLRPVNPRRVQRNDKGMSHLAAYDVSAHLTRIFGFGGWRKEILALDLVAEDAIADEKRGGRLGWWITYRCTMRLHVKAISPADGWASDWWNDDGATGSAANLPDRGDAHDFAMKNAISYALKRCAKDLGDQFGLSLYNRGSVQALVGRTLSEPGLNAATGEERLAILPDELAPDWDEQPPGRDDGLPVNADGSLSRSRTSDAEKDAAGNMTSEQWAEHTELQKGAVGKVPAAERGKVERFRPSRAATAGTGSTPGPGGSVAALPDDDWYDQPPPEREPRSALSGKISREQQKMMHAKFTELGITDREARLAWTRRALKLDRLDSSSDLSYRQAGDLLAALQRAGNGQEAT